MCPFIALILFSPEELLISCFVWLKTVLSLSIQTGQILLGGHINKTLNLHFLLVLSTLVANLTTIIKQFWALLTFGVSFEWNSNSRKQEQFLEPLLWVPLDTFHHNTMVMAVSRSWRSCCIHHNWSSFSWTSSLWFSYSCLLGCSGCSFLCSCYFLYWTCFWFFSSCWAACVFRLSFL